MTNQIPKEVTFKMRKGKKIEMVINCLWCLGLSIFTIWMTIQGKDTWALSFTLFMIFLPLFPIAGIAVFASAMTRSSLTLSEGGLWFTGAFSSKKQASWKEVKNFYENGGEIYLRIETPSGKQKFEIPISWFAKMPPGKKPYPADAVINRLLVFAPHLFNDHPSD